MLIYRKKGNGPTDAIFEMMFQLEKCKDGSIVVVIHG